MTKGNPAPAPRAAPALDPLQLPTLWHLLASLTDEAAVVLTRTAFSTILRDANDYSCILLDRHGTAVAENSWSIPNFVGCVSKTMTHVLEKLPAATWRDGDVVVTNDPWISTGHLPDFTVVTPILRDGGVFGFAASVAHHIDVGGAIWSADTTDLFEEGLRVPITHLYRAGEPVEPVMDIIAKNVRVPEQVIGDLHAQIAANRTIERRVQELAGSGELDDLGAIGQAMQARAEARMREAIAEVADGVYRSECEIDGFDAPLTLKLALHVRGNSILLDYDGTSPQQRHGINVPINNTFSMSSAALKSVLDPTTPRNEGSYRPFTVRAPEGCLVNARFPAAVNARHLTFLHFASLVFQALADVLPERVLGESGSPFIQVIFAGRDRHGQPFVHTSFDSAGMGARAGKDGLSATPYPNNTGGAPIEFVEASTPLVFHEKVLVADSGGPGRFRGGLGCRMTVESRASEPLTLSLQGDRIRHPARGIRGGSPGMHAAVTRNGEPLNAKGRTLLHPGDRLVVRNAGGGGYGPPAERAAEALAADLEGGYVTTREAQENYPA